jgi:Protein of unknown function (DUF3303)
MWMRKRACCSWSSSAFATVIPLQSTAVSAIVAALCRQDGLHYRGSWIETNFDRCFQLMECDDEQLFAAWVANWNDLMDFEVVPVTTSAEMQKTLFPKL